MYRPLLVASTLLATATSLHAQTTVRREAGDRSHFSMAEVSCEFGVVEVKPEQVAQERSRRPRSPGAASALSALGIAAPVLLGRAVEDHEGTGLALAVGGIVLGPALGYVYAGQTGRGLSHAGLRALVLGGAVGGTLGICSVGDCSLGIFGPSGAALAPAMVLLIGGSLATTWLALHDISRVADHLRARNEGFAALTVQPTYFRESRSPGLLVTWRR